MYFRKLLALLIGLSTLPALAPAPILAGSPVAANPIARSVPTIDEAEIQKMITEIRSALKNRNIEGIVKYYAPFITSQLTVKSDDRSETFELDGLQENTAYLTNAFKSIKNVEVLAENWDVDILANNEMGMIRRQRVVNITTTDGKTYIIDSRAIARVANVDGALKIVSIDETAEVSRRPN